MGCASSEPVYPDAVSKTPPRPPPEKEISKFKAPPEELIAELLSTGKVVPDEVAGPQDFTMYHKNVTGTNRGHKPATAGVRCTRSEYVKKNLAKLSNYTSWAEIDFEDPNAPDPDFCFGQGMVKGVNLASVEGMKQLRPIVVVAQARMLKEYSAAYEAARAKPGAADIFARLEVLPDKRAKVAQPQGKELTITQLYNGALGALPDLWRFGKKTLGASGEEGAKLEWGLKKPQRIWFKLHTKYSYDLSKVTDCARISLTFKTAEGIERAANFVIKQAATCKNRVAEPTPEGYRDFMFTMAMPNGHVCEIQLHLKEMMSAKKSGAGHKMYKLCRRVLLAPLVDKDTYCYEVRDGKLLGKMERNDKGEREGFGTIVYADGSMFEGHFRANKRHGTSTHYTAIGDKFVGEYKDGKKDGHWEMYRNSGNVFVGEYKDDEKEGKGIQYYASGNVFIGEYKADMKNGKGIEWKNGNVNVGTWVKDKPKDEGLQWYWDKDKFGKPEIHAWRLQDGEALGGGEGRLSFEDSVRSCEGMGHRLPAAYFQKGDRPNGSAYGTRPPTLNEILGNRLILQTEHVSHPAKYQGSH